jgi:hypothetical protein
LDPQPALRTALESFLRLAREHDRPHLAEAATSALRRLDTDVARVAVIGEFKHGKSSLVNALVDAPVCAVDDDIATAAPIEIGFADPAAARCWRVTPAGTADRIDIAPADAAAASTDPDTARLRVGLPRALLRSGLVLIDTPGVGGVRSAAALTTASTLDDAHAVLFVSDAAQELTRAEAEALRDAVSRCPRAFLVKTKIDLSPAWRRIVDTDRRHLDRLGIDVPVFPVSSALRMRALRAGDRKVNDESGFPPLVHVLAHDLARDRARLAADAALHAARRIHAQLREPSVRAIEAAASRSSEERAGHVTAARHELETLRERAGAWQQVLNDGWTDLVANVDNDLRERVRLLLQDADELIDAADPDAVWSQFEPDMYRRTAEALDANLAVLRTGARDLAERLTALVDDDECSLLASLDREIGDEPVLAAMAALPRADDRSAGTRAQQAFRAGYGGAMPIMALGGMALGVLGLGTLVLPLAGVAGVLAGRRAVVDDRDRRVAQRRQQAKSAVKRYVDEASQRAQLERRRAQRQVQRAIRDHLTVRMKALLEMRRQALALAEEMAVDDERARRERSIAATAELDRIDRVARTLAEHLLRERGSAPVSGVSS